MSHRGSVGVARPHRRLHRLSDDLHRLLDERRFDPPRDVEVENDGRWWSGHQTAWRLCDDGFGWRAAVTWRQLHYYGWGRHLTSGPPERVRLRAR